MGYHDLAGHERQKPRQNNETPIPPQANILAAASHIRRLFESKKFTYAVMGELAMLCLGHRCQIRDILIAYDDKDYNRMKKKLEGDRRIQLPAGMTPLFPSKILVQTGPGFLDTGCTNTATIEVTLIPPGSYDTPPNGNLANNLVLLSLRTDGMLKTFYALNMLYLVRTLLHFCQIHSLAREPRNDILFLCQHYRDQLESIRCHLSPKVVEESFLQTPFLRQLPVQEQRRCYQTLLAQEPPFLNMLAPSQGESGHIRSQSASGVMRSPGISRASLPDFLCPPQSRNIKSSNMRTAYTTSKLGEQPKTSPQTTSSSRDSSSRYRVVSAPNSRRSSPTDRQPGSNPRVQPAHNKHLTIQIPASPYNEPKFSHSVTNVLPVSMYQARRQCSRSQAGFTGERVAQPPVTRAPIADTQSRPGIVTGNQSARQSHPASSGAHKPEQRSSRLHVVNLDGKTLSSLTCEETEEETHKLHLVGPEGVYQSPPTSRKPSPATSKTRTASTNPPPDSDINATPPSTDILAELSANIDAALQVSNHPRTSPTPETIQPQQTNRPPTSRAHSAPHNTLPPSLTIGNPAHQNPLAGSITRTNALRYSQQHLAHSLAPMTNSGPALLPLAPAPLSVYKAYQQVLVPASSPKTDVSPLDSAISEYNSQFANFGQVKDVDGMGHYLATHNRNASHDVRPLTQSFDSNKLAMEYRAALPTFEDGYGGR